VLSCLNAKAAKEREGGEKMDGMDLMDGMEGRMLSFEKSMKHSMDLKEAQLAIRDDKEEWVNWVLASGVIVDSRDSTFEDLLACLKRRGLPAEGAACGLYRRTKRERTGRDIESFDMDFGSWEKYLRERRLIS
jgi:hypothetical protein